MLEQYLENIRQTDQSVNPLFTLLGIRVVAIEKDSATLSLIAKPELMQGAGQLAGGILATLLDETMAHAVLGGNDPTRITTTVDMNVSYYRPVHKGDEIVCVAHVTKRGGRVVFAEAIVHNEEQKVAGSNGTFLVINPK